MVYRVDTIGCTFRRTQRQTPLQFMADFDMQVSSTVEAEQELGSSGGPGRSSQWEPVAEKYAEISGSDQAIVLRELSQNDVQNIRNLLYRRFGKEQVIVRSSSNGEDEYKAVVRDRDGDEYLRNGDSEDTSDTVSEDTASDEPEDELDEEVF